MIRSLNMATMVYGASDDLIEIDGGFRGEVGCYGTDDGGNGVLLIFSDGTILNVKYGKGGKGIWGLVLFERGYLFEQIDLCTDEEADPHSDVARFRPGIKWAYAATEWEPVT